MDDVGGTFYIVVKQTVAIVVTLKLHHELAVGC